MPRKPLSSAFAIKPAPTSTIACEITVKRNVCQTACWNAGFPHSRLKFSSPTHLPCNPVVAFVKLSQIASASGPATSAVTKMTAGEMRTEARTPGRSNTFVQRLPRGRATAAASTPRRSYIEFGLAVAEITLEKLTKVYGDGTRAVSELDLE